MSDDPYRSRNEPRAPQNGSLLFRPISLTWLAAVVGAPVILFLAAAMLLTPTVGTDPDSKFEEVEMNTPVDREVQSGDLQPRD